MREARGGVRILEGRFSVTASLDRARSVLADFERLPKFVSNVQSSRVIRRGTESAVVEQVMTGKVGLFRKKIHLRLEIYLTPTSISFRDVSGRSFKSYEGSWGLIDNGKFVNVFYELQAVPAFFSPGFLTDKAFRNAVEQQLTEVRDEIANRSSSR